MKYSESYNQLLCVCVCACVWFLVVQFLLLKLYWFIIQNIWDLTWAEFGSLLGKVLCFEAALNNDIMIAKRCSYHVTKLFEVLYIYL